MNFQYKNYQIFIIFYLILVWYSIIGSQIIDLGNNYQDILASKSTFEIILIFIIFGTIETLIAQSLISEIITIIVSNNYKIAIIYLVSTIAFAFMHYDNNVNNPFLLVSIQLLPGWLFISYYQLSRKISINQAILRTSLLHISTNISIFLISKFL